MKKALAVVLAVVLAFGMSTVAFAAKVLDLGSLGSDLFLYNEEKAKMESIGVGSDPVPSGSTLYIPLITRLDTSDGIKSARTTTISDMSNYKLKSKVTESTGIFGGARFAVKQDYQSDNAMHIAVSTIPNNTTENIVVAFTLTVIPKDGATVEEFDSEIEYEFSFTVAPAKKGSAASEAQPAPEKTTPPAAAAETKPAAGVQVNPDTGAPGFIAFAVVAALLGAAFLVLRKKD